MFYIMTSKNFLIIIKIIMETIKELYVQRQYIRNLLKILMMDGIHII